MNYYLIDFSILADGNWRLIDQKDFRGKSHRLAETTAKESTWAAKLRAAHPGRHYIGWNGED
jgi:hypothetical protein